MNSMRSIKGLLKLWAAVFLLLLIGFMFVSVTPWLVNADNDFGISLMLLMWATLIYCVAVVTLKFALNKKEKK